MKVDSLFERTKQVKIAAAALAVVVVAGGLMFSMATMAGTASASAQVHDYSVPDASFESDNVEEVYITFQGPTVSWSDTPAPVEEFDVRIYVDGPDGNTQEAYSMSCHHENAPSECGFERATSESVYLDAEVGPALISSTDWTSDHFTPEPGESVSQTIEMSVEFEIMWDGGSLTETASDTTTITVEHPDEQSSDTNESTSSDSSADPEANIEFGSANVVAT